MANRFTAAGSAADDAGLRLSNGGTDVLFDVLTLAGCDLAETAWERLRYDPPLAPASLATYRAMIAQFTPVPSPGPEDWSIAPPPELLARCPAHDLFQGELGCRRCDPDSGPIG